MASRAAKALRVLRDQYRRTSPAEFARFLAQSLFANEKILIYARSLPGFADVAADARTDAGNVRQGCIEELVSARRDLDSAPWEFQCDRYDGVTDFFVHKDNDRTGHISWIYYERHPNRILRLAEGDCEVKFCLTFPEFRGKGLYPAALKAIQRYVKERGYRRCFVCVKADNLPSIRGIEKAGFHLVGTTRVQKAFGLQISARRSTRQLAPPPLAPIATP